MLIFKKSKKNFKVVSGAQTRSLGNIIKIFHGFTA